MDEVAIHDDWDQHWSGIAESASRNPAQAMRRRLIRQLLRADGSGTRILDIGCGQGDLIAELRRHYQEAELCGVDASQFGIDVALSKVPGAKFERRDLVAPGDPAPDLAAWATHAVCSEVLEHVDDPETLLSNARAYLAPACRLIVTVPGGPISAFDRHIGHRRHYTPESLGRTLVAAGFEVEAVTGAGFPFFNLYRTVVILRGDRLAADVGAAGSAGPSTVARLVMRLFHPLLATPLPKNRLGWQVVGVARVPGGAAKSAAATAPAGSPAM